MYLNFEITNDKITRKNIEENYEEKNKCFFVFNTKEWNHLEKYAIFWTDKNKSIIRYLGEGRRLKCKIPEEMTDVFSIQVYANDNVKTNKIQIGTTITKPNKECPKPIKRDEKKCDTTSIFYDIYKQLEQKIDRIKYVNNTFYIYSSNKLIKAVDLYDKSLIKKLIEDELISLNIDSEMSDTSVNALQNKVITQELNKKEDSSNLHTISRTGDYSDLENKPNEFNPSQHTHRTTEIIDFDHDVDGDIEIMIMKLTDNILGM